FHFCQTEWISEKDILLDPTATINKNIKVLNNESHHKVDIHSTINPQTILESTEKDLIIHALQSANGNRTKAAEILNISRSTLYYKLRKFDIQEVNTFR